MPQTVVVLSLVVLIAVVFSAPANLNMQNQGMQGHKPSFDNNNQSAGYNQSQGFRPSAGNHHFPGFGPSDDNDTQEFGGEDNEFQFPMGGPHVDVQDHSKDAPGELDLSIHLSIGHAKQQDNYFNVKQKPNFALGGFGSGPQPGNGKRSGGHGNGNQHP